MNSNPISLLIFVLLLIPGALAETQNDLTRVLLKGKSIDGVSYAVTAREKAHVLGQKFQVELRYDCSNNSQLSPEVLPVQDSFSVCDLSPQSLRENLSRTAIAVKTKRADINSYYDQLERKVQQPNLSCHKTTEIKKFSLQGLCK